MTTRFLLLTVLLLPVRSVSAWSEEVASQVDRQTLEAQVNQILAQDNISQRRDVEAVFQLADLRAGDGNDQEAIRLYQAGLRVDSWRLEYQLKLAQLLLRYEGRDEAVEKATTVYQYAEDPQLVEAAGEFLSGLGIQRPAVERPKQPLAMAQAEIVLVPIGGVRRWLLEEITPELQARLNVIFSIASDEPLGALDRSYADRYLAVAVEGIRAQLAPEEFAMLLDDTNLSDADLRSPRNAQRFVEQVLRRNATSGAVQEFRAALKEVEGHGQYDANRLLSMLKAGTSGAGRPAVKGYLGVTEADLFSGDNNFVFGWAEPGYGVMSYYRFLASTNDEPPNRPRLRERFVKQALSSSFFVLGIPRCTSPVCVRAYPHSLTEHDQKGTELCAWCKEQLRSNIGHTP